MSLSLATGSKISESRSFAVRLLAAQDRPHDAGILVCDGDDCSIEAASLAETVHPAALRVGLSCRRTNHRSRAMHDQSSEMLIATFADAEELRPISTGVLARHQAEPGSHVASVFELPTIADGSDNGCRDLRADAFDLRDSLRKAARSEGFVDATIEHGNPMIDLAHKIEKLCDRCSCAARQAVLGVLQCQRDHAPRVADVARKYDATISQEAAYLACERCAVVDQALSGTMQGLNILLFHRPLGNEAHVGLLNSNADRLSVVAVIFLVAPKRLDVLWADDPDFMPETLELATR
jgi:hypothetical protein